MVACYCMTKVFCIFSKILHLNQFRKNTNITIIGHNFAYAWARKIIITPLRSAKKIHIFSYIIGFCASTFITRRYYIVCGSEPFSEILLKSSEPPGSSSHRRRGPWSKDQKGPLYFDHWYRQHSWHSLLTYVLPVPVTIFSLRGKSLYPILHWKGTNSLILHFSKII